jgi:hypothetical protein
VPFLVGTGEGLPDVVTENTADFYQRPTQRATIGRHPVIAGERVRDRGRYR